MATVPDAVPQDPLLRHSNFAVTMHWLIVLLLLTQVWLGFTFHGMERGPARAEYFTWHKTVGATILVLGGRDRARAVWRSAWRPTGGR